MNNNTQLDRYKRLLQFLEKRFKEDVNIQAVEAISHYSYRNINRIFQALHDETIGHYVKRLRLERAAQYLKYSTASISAIAYDIGFEDLAAFSKSFKKRYHCTPSSFRKRHASIQRITQQTLTPQQNPPRQKLAFEITYLPDFEFLALEYRGAYEDLPALRNNWDVLLDYAAQQQLLTDETIYMAELLDDDAISDAIHCRYRSALLLQQPLSHPPEGLFTIHTHQRQKYAMFVHQGSHETCADTYHEIYAFWMLDVQLEMKDLPVLEFYVNDDPQLPQQDWLTEIYIPIV